MNGYIYRGYSRNGKPTRGRINAPDEAAARAKARLLGINVKSISVGGTDSKERRNWRPIEINEKGEIKVSLKPPSVSTKEISIMTRQFSVLINAGVPVVQCFSMLLEQTENAYLKSVLISVKDQISSGADLSSALARHPDVFDELYTSLVQAGSTAGALDKMLEKLSDYLERSAKLKRQLTGALTYPAAVIVVAIVLLVFELVFVVPMFTKYFDDAGQTLPEFTLMVIGASDFVINNGLYILIILWASGYFLAKWYRTPKGRLKFDELLLKIPVFGEVLTKIALARFSTTMSTLITGGVALIETLEICGRAAGNHFVEKEIAQVRSEVAQGQSMADALQRRPMMPIMMTGMVRVGEASGQLDKMFQKISDFYESEVDAVIAQALKLLEPILFVVLGGIVGVVLIAMYLPIFDLASTQSGTGV